MPRRVAPDHSIIEKKYVAPKKQGKRVNPRSDWEGTRKLDAIVDSGAYEKSDFKPTPISNFFIHLTNNLIIGTAIIKI